MAKIGLPKGSGKRLNVREKAVKSQGILIWILSGNPEKPADQDLHPFLLEVLNFEKVISTAVCLLGLIIMGLDSRKPFFGGLRTTKAQTDQRLCYSHFGKYHI